VVNKSGGVEAVVGLNIPRRSPPSKRQNGVIYKLAPSPSAAITHNKRKHNANPGSKAIVCTRTISEPAIFLDPFDCVLILTFCCSAPRLGILPNKKNSGQKDRSIILYLATSLIGAPDLSNCNTTLSVCSAVHPAASFDCLLESS
jgi:hypothetical protein